MAIGFFFEYNNQVVRLPVNPEKITITKPGNNKTEEIVSIGEINILREPKLSSCSINSFLPVNSNAPYVLTAAKFEAPQFYIDFFNKIMTDKKPARFIISGTLINMLVSIEKFDYTLTAGDDDTYFTLDLKEYKKYSAKVVKIQTNTNTTTATTTGQQREKTGLAIGDEVVVNGKYWYDSYGASPYGTFSNFTGKISHIVANKSRKYRYHITTLDGRWRGWVAEEQITII